MEAGSFYSCYQQSFLVPLGQDLGEGRGPLSGRRTLRWAEAQINMKRFFSFRGPHGVDLCFIGPCHVTVWLK